MSKKRRWSGAAKRSVKRYNSYVKEFRRRSRLMEERGLRPYEDKPLSYRDYKYIYSEERNDRLKEIEKGERASLGNINSKIVSDQIYELSEKQAYAIFDYINTLSPEERKGIKLNMQNINRAIQKIREGSFVREDLGLWDAIRARRKELFEQGLKKAEVAAIVSNEFFYPEEDEE